MNRAEEKTFQEFIDKYNDKAMRTLSSRFSDLSQEEIKDVIQDSYVVMYDNIGKEKISEPLYPYFLKICINLLHKVLRKHGGHIVSGIIDSDVKQKNTVSMYRVESILQVCEEQDSIIKEKKQFVHEALNEMASRCRDLLWSFYAEELSWSTIAGQNGIKNADTAKSMASRCRQTFKEKYLRLKRRIYGN